MTVADRIAVMDEGKLIQVATPTEIYEQPATRYVADFIGDVNFLEGRIAAVRDNEIELASAEVACPILVSGEGVSADSGAPAWLAIRPEKMRISHEAPADASSNCVKGKVWDIAYLGDLSIYHVRLANGHVIKSSQTNVTRLVERPITWEDEVYLSWPRDAGVVLTR